MGDSFCFGVWSATITNWRVSCRQPWAHSSVFFWDIYLNILQATPTTTSSHGAVVSVLHLAGEHDLIPDIVWWRVWLPSVTNTLIFFGQWFESWIVFIRVWSPKFLCKWGLIPGLLWSRVRFLCKTKLSEILWFFKPLSCSAVFQEWIIRPGGGSCHHWMSIAAPSIISQESCIILQGKLNYLTPGQAHEVLLRFTWSCTTLAWTAIISIHHCCIVLPSTYPSITGVAVWSIKIFFWMKN